MPVVIPSGFALVIQPVTSVATGDVSSVTYAIQPEALEDPQDAVDQADTAFRTGFPASVLDSNARYDPATMYFRVGLDLFLLTSSLAPAVGTFVQASPPPQVAIVIRKRTQFVGRKRRGRIFLPHWFIGENVVGEDGVLTGAAVIAIQGRADLWYQSLIDAPAINGAMRLLHGNAVDVPDVVTTLLVQPIVRTQRRRLPRG